MAKKKIGKHLRFYMNCMKNGEMPRAGLCACAWNDYLMEESLMLFKPDDAGMFSYWGSEKKGYDECYTFTKLRQTIVLFLAAINNEL
jgi:hypothetical protein